MSVNNMEAKLQALFQTMVAESVVETTTIETTQEEVVDSGQIIRLASQADKENANAASHIVTDPSGITEIVYAQDEEIEQEVEVEEEELEEIEEEEEGEETVKLVFQTTLEKPLQSGILKGLNRLNGFPCTYCSRVLATKYSLMIHTRIHTGEKPHHCTVCTSKFIHPTDLRRHMLKHTGEKPFKCDVCGARFTQTTSLKGHSRQHPGEKPHKCEVCDESFVAAVLLKTHVRSHNQVQTFKCTHCDETFGSVEQVMEHCQNYHTISVSFDQVQATNKTEPTALVDVSSIMYGRKRKRGKYPCEVCDSVLSTAYSLQIHKRTHTGEKPYACHMCDYRSTCLSMLKRHVLTHSSEKPFQCDQCTKSFRQMPHLRKHQQIHENKQRKCKKCDEAFPKLADLVQHWNNTHVDPELPYLCVDCFQEFDDEDTLQEHKSDKHAWKQGEFACDKCGTVFNRKGNLKKHLERVDCAERPFGCEMCDQAFRKKKGLEEHMLKEHGVEKEYECPKCKKVFKMEKLLKMHEKRTHGFVKSKCNLCPNRIFESRQVLMEHQKRRHVAKLIQIDVASANKTSPPADESDDGPHPIKVTSRRRGRLLKHKGKLSRARRSPTDQEKKELEQKKFPCRICEKEFNTRDDVLKHFQSHRKNPGCFASDEEEDLNLSSDDGERTGYEEEEEKDSDDMENTFKLQDLATLATAEQTPDIGNYVLVELVGQDDGDSSTTGIVEADDSMNAVVKRLLSEDPSVQKHIDDLIKNSTTQNASVVAELILGDNNATSVKVENMES